MSFVFRAFTKSRRKKNKGHSAYGASVTSVDTLKEDGEALSNTFQNTALSKRNRPQHIVASQTDEEDDDKTHPMNEQSPSHCSGISSVASNTPATTVLHGKPTKQRLDSHANKSSGSVDPSKRHLFRSLRRKPDLDTIHQGTKTPDTSAASSTAATPFSSSSSALCDTPTVTRGIQNRFSEIYSPNGSVPRKLSFHEDASSAAAGNASSQENPSKMCDVNSLVSSKNASDLKRGKRKDVESRNQPNMKLCDDRFGTSKTMIMNGDIVVCPTYSNGTSDTATTASAASSKARALRREAERIARAASALDNKGNELFERGQFDKAMACYSKALKLKRRTFSHLLEEADDMEEQLMMCEKNQADPQLLVSMATSINNIGYLRQRSGDATPDETMAAYKKSLKIKRRILGNDSLSVGKTLNNIGSVHYLKREFDQALPAYEEALHVMKANLGDKHPDVATVMSNIGDVYLGQGNNAVSLLKYRQALTIRWESFGEKDPRVVRLLEKIAKVEMGDLMLAPKAGKDKAELAWDEDEASEFMESGMRPISEELQILQKQIAKDIDDVDSMERKAKVELLKDKIIIIRGMRAIWEGEGPELLDNDTASVMTGMSLKSQGCIQGRRL
jgi:tetratricopeptide (TPR) repeat protein